MVLTAVIVSLIVLLGALLMGKMLKDLYPNALFGASRKPGADDTPPKA